MTAVQPTTSPSSSATHARSGSHRVAQLLGGGHVVSKVALRVARPSA